MILDVTARLLLRTAMLRQENLIQPALRNSRNILVNGRPTRLIEVILIPPGQGTQDTSCQPIFQKRSAPAVLDTRDTRERRERERKVFNWSSNITRDWFQRRRSASRVDVTKTGDTRLQDNRGLIRVAVANFLGDFHS